MPKSEVRATVGRPPAVLRITEAERVELLVLTSHEDGRARLRSRIVLMSSDGHANHAIARTLAVNVTTVSKWRGRFARFGFEGLKDRPRPGRPVWKDHAAILAALEEPPPCGGARWSRRLIAARVGNVSADTVGRVLRKANRAPHLGV